MSAISGVLTIERSQADIVPDPTSREAMPGGITLSAVMHLALLTLIVLGLPSLFSPPPPQESPIAVDLVTIAPETKATHPNPFRPRRDAKPDQAVAPPAPQPKPEPPQPPTAAAPPSSAAPPPPPAPPKPEATHEPPPPPPPPPKPVEAQAPPRPPEPKPHIEPRPQPREMPQPPRPEAKPVNAKAFSQLLDKLDERKPEPHPQPAAFDSLLKNLTRQQTAETEDAPPAPRKMASAAAPSSQPQHAPLGSELTASQKDMIIQQIERCWNVPAGARDAQDLTVEIKAVVNQDGTVSQAMVVDSGRYGSDPFFRAAADSAKRAVLNPQCTGPGSPLPVPPDKYEVWHNLDLFFNPKDLL